MQTTPEEAAARPLLTQTDMIGRIEDLLAPAAHPGQLWVLFLDELRCQVPMLLPIDQIPRRPSGDVVRAILAPVAEGIRGRGIASVIFVLERLGPGRITAEDRCWADHLVRAWTDEGLVVTGTFLLVPGAVRPLDPT